MGIGIDCGINIQSCGHYIHLHCQISYFKSLKVFKFNNKIQFQKLRNKWDLNPQFGIKFVCLTLILIIRSLIVCYLYWYLIEVDTLYGKQIF